MQVQRNASISGSCICPCPLRRNPLLWGRFGMVEDTWFNVRVEFTTNIQRPTSLGWAFLFPESARVAGFPRFCVCQARPRNAALARLLAPNLPSVLWKSVPTVSRWHTQIA